MRAKLRKNYGSLHPLLKVVAGRLSEEGIKYSIIVQRKPPHFNIEERTVIAVNPHFINIVIRIEGPIFILRKGFVNATRGWRADMANPGFDIETIVDHIIEMAKSAQAIEKMVKWEWSYERPK